MIGSWLTGADGGAFPKQSLKDGEERGQGCESVSLDPQSLILQLPWIRLLSITATGATSSRPGCSVPPRVGCVAFLLHHHHRARAASHRTVSSCSMLSHLIVLLSGVCRLSPSPRPRPRGWDGSSIALFLGIGRHGEQGEPHGPRTARPLASPGPCLLTPWDGPLLVTGQKTLQALRALKTAFPPTPASS